MAKRGHVDYPRVRAELLVLPEKTIPKRRASFDS